MKKSRSNRKVSLANPRIPIVGIGASAGGLDAIKEFFTAIPNTTGMAFVVVQHLDPKHGSLAAEILARTTEMPVRDIRSGQKAKPNEVYVIPSNHALEIRKGILKLTPRKDGYGQQRVIDSFLVSLADDLGEQAIGVILSGTANDGTVGLRSIKSAGGLAVAQDPASAKFDGMPKSAIASGVVDIVLPPAEIAQELARIAKHQFTPRPKSSVPKEDLEDSLRQLFAILRARTHVDFSHYKRSTVMRRIERRMTVRRSQSVAEYVAYLNSHPEESRALFDDILINVTEFFRDEDSFKVLAESILPKLLKGRDENSPIRVWVPGCSTGEEVYSIAITLLEYQEKKGTQIPIQIFATDISEPAIQKARAGVFAGDLEKHVGKERLKRFFEKIEGHYKINKSIRDLCLFSRHDVTCDPPFSRLDLISCRNLLIYFDSNLQKRVMPIFHYALNPGGALWLGRSESPGENSRLFSTLKKAHRFYSKNNIPSPSNVRFPANLFLPELRATERKSTGRFKEGNEIVREADRIALARFTPPSVIVNADLEILQFRGRTGLYLEPASGSPNSNLLRMARPEIVRTLRLAVQTAKMRGKSVQQGELALSSDGRRRLLTVEMIPINPQAPPKQRNYLICFQEETVPSASGKTSVGKGEKGSTSGMNKKIRQLEVELTASRQMQDAMAEEFEVTQEELTSANEELQSTNEELQSTNEELETAKEELQSSNEELTTVNDELRNKNSDLLTLTGDLNNILRSVQIPIVIVNADHRIHRFTPGAEKAFKLIAGDIGRPVGDIRPNFEADLESLVEEVTRTLTPLEKEIRDHDGRWLRLQIRPYMSVDNRIDGAVIALVDIEDLKKNLDLSATALSHAVAVANTIPIPFAVLDQHSKIKTSNRAFNKYFGASLAGISIFDLLNCSTTDKERLTETLTGSMDSDRAFSDFKMEYISKNQGVRSLVVSGQQVQWLDHETHSFLISLEDTTEHQKLLKNEENARSEAEKANEAKDIFLATLSHELRTPLNVIQSWVQMLVKDHLDSSKVKKAHKMIEQNASALELLVNDLLDVSRIILGKLVLELGPVDLNLIIPEVIESLHPYADQKAVAIQCKISPQPIMITADPARLRQILWNLVNNAIKFSNHGGTIELHLLRNSDHGVLKVTMSVVDHGIGISKKFLPRIFERFTQGNSSQTREPIGLGLGLAIVRNLVELHGGRIWAESPGEGQGATFFVELPAAKPNADLKLVTDPGKIKKEPNELDKSPGNEALKGIEVLLVDDDADTRDVLTIALETYGASVRSVATVADALESLANAPPHVVVSDIAMPGEDGFSFIANLRTRGSKQAHLPAIALSAYAEPEAVTRALKAGFSAHLAKPIKLNRLINTINKLAAR